MSLLSKLVHRIGGNRGKDNLIPHKSASSPGARTVPEDRPLNADERTLIEWLIINGAQNARPYAQQLNGLHVVSHCSCGCPSVDLAVADANVSTTGPSQILADFLGLTPENIQVGVVLHAREGKISELEIYPLGETTGSLPKIESLKPLE